MVDYEVSESRQNGMCCIRIERRLIWEMAAHAPMGSESSVTLHVVPEGMQARGMSRRIRGFVEYESMTAHGEERHHGHRVCHALTAKQVTEMLAIMTDTGMPAERRYLLACTRTDQGFHPIGEIPDGLVEAEEGLIGRILGRRG